MSASTHPSLEKKPLDRVPPNLQQKYQVGHRCTLAPETPDYDGHMRVSEAAGYLYVLLQTHWAEPRNYFLFQYL